MIERLGSADRLVLGADATWPQDVGALLILDRDVRADEVRRALSGRLNLVPRFRQRVVRPRRGLGGPIWVDDATFDLGDHVKVRPLPAGSADDALLRAAEAIRRTRLDMSRPLWEAWLLPGLKGGRAGLFLRFHHVVGDGRASLSMLGALLDTDPSAVGERLPPWVPAPPPSARALLADNIRRRLAGVAAGFRALAHPRAAFESSGPPCPGRGSSWPRLRATRRASTA